MTKKHLPTVQEIFRYILLKNRKGLISDLAIIAITESCPDLSEDDIAEHVEKNKDALQKYFLSQEDICGKKYSITDYDNYFIKVKHYDCDKYLMPLSKISGEDFAHLSLILLQHIYPQGKFIETILDKVDDSYCVDIKGDISFSSVNEKIHMIVQCKKKTEFRKEITLNELKQFVGGVKGYIYQQKENKKISEMHPILLGYFSNAFFHEDAQSYAEKVGIKLIDADKFIKLLIRAHLTNELTKIL